MTGKTDPTNVEGSTRATAPAVLYREVFAATDPEAAARALAAQTVHNLLLETGLESGLELVDLLTPAQYQQVLDFDLWSGDELNEERVYAWLMALEQDGGLEACEKFLTNLDPALLALIVSRRVTVHYSEEKTELPPGPNFFTPDHGSTWLSLGLENTDHYRMLGKALALLFEQDAKRFYQLLATSAASTSVEQEELAFQERCRRLWDLGIPDRETSAAIHRPLPVAQLKELLATGTDAGLITLHHQPVPALVYGVERIEPLASILDELRQLPRPGLSSREAMADEVDGELAFLLNAAIVYSGIDYSDREEVERLLRSVQGALNIGLQVLSQAIGGSTIGPLQQHGLQAAYRLGLAELLPVRLQAQRALARPDLAQSIEEEPALRLRLKCLGRPLPEALQMVPSRDGLREEPRVQPLVTVDGVREALTFLQTFQN